MKTLYFNIFGLGHILPTLPLLKDLGDVVYYTTPERKSLVESAGAEFRNYGRDSYKAADYNPGTNFVLQTIPATVGLLPYLLSEVEKEKPDQIFYDSMAPWGKALSEITGVPSTCTVTTFALSLERKADMFRRFGVAPDQVNLDSMKVLKDQYDVTLTLEDALGAYGEKNLVFTTKDFNPPVENPDRFTFLGPRLDRTEDLSGFRIPLAGKKIITMSVGTLLLDEDPTVQDWFRELIRAFGDDPEYELILAGGNLGELPGNIHSYERIPQLEALRRSHVFINHGGMNSINEGLHFKVPMIAIPHSKDQFINAERLKETGKGIVIDRKNVKAHILRSCVERLIRRGP